MSYAGPSSFAIPSSMAMWIEANERSRALPREEDQAARNSYMTPHERQARGFLCEIALSAWLGVPYAAPWGIRVAECPDVADRYEAKWMGWRRASHMDLMEGGTLYVPGHVSAPVIVGMTAFDATLTERVFIEGSIDRAVALGYPQGGKVRGKSGRYAHLVPYAALRPWEEIPRDRPAG